MDWDEIRDKLSGTFQRKMTRFVPSHTGTFDSGRRADIFPSVDELTDSSSLVRFCPLRVGGVALVFVLVALSSSGIVVGLFTVPCTSEAYGLTILGFFFCFGPTSAHGFGRELRRE